MGRIWMPGGGGGADLDVITAGAGDVLDGKVIVDKDGNPLTGTMPIRGAVSQELAAGGSYTVPAGYHNGNGVITAKNLASQTAGTAGAADIRKNKTAFVNGVKVTGSMAEKAAATYTPKAAAQTIAAGQYLAGAQTIAGDSKLIAANIKKGVKIFGITGTWEGYVATATDLYNRGAIGLGGGFNIRSEVSQNAVLSFQTTYMLCTPYYGFAIHTKNKINLAGYKKLNIIVTKNTDGGNGPMWIFGVAYNAVPTYTNVDYNSGKDPVILRTSDIGNANDVSDTTTVLSADISTVGTTCYPGIYFSYGNVATSSLIRIYRMWLS